MPEGWVELKLEGVQFGNCEKESAHNICLDEPAVTFFLQGVIAVLCLFVAFHQGIIPADIFILVDSIHRIFVNPLLDKECGYNENLPKLIAQGLYLEIQPHSSRPQRHLQQPLPIFTFLNDDY